MARVCVIGGVDVLISLQSTEFRVDGRAQLVLAGEIHYFRLARAAWASRLDLLAQTGADTVATYIPWAVHELSDGSVDLVGRTRPELDLGAFIDLAAERGLRFLARPGPFTMGEIRHEGIPPRVAAEHPEIRPVGWDGTPATSADLDYLAPAFLAESRRWYSEVGAVLAPRMAAHGGPVVAVQLDNEIGMLAWVTNTPALTDGAVADLVTFLRQRHGADLGARYPGLESSDAAAVLRSPGEAIAAALRVDLAYFMRDRFARYVATLRDYAIESAFGTAPLLINIHGTEAGGASSFPIGISQLMDTYRDIPGMASGSDHYVGTLTFGSAAELHMVHAFMDAVNGPDQPLTSLEFEAGTGDYGSDLGNLTDPSAVILKTRLLLAQGNRMFNWYLFAGGTNFPDPRQGDVGTHRFGITGQRHGHAAPVTPEGGKGPSFASTAESIALAHSHSCWAATWQPETDHLALGFVADHYATEYVYRGNDVMPDLAAELSWARGGGPGSVLPRLLLGAGFRYTAVDLQRPLVDSRTIVLGSPGALDTDVQQRLVDHVVAGGGLLVFGALPQQDLQGRPCTVLADALGLSVTATIGGESLPSVVGDGWAAGEPETRVGRLQHLSVTRGTVLLRDAITGDPCAAEIPLCDGLVTVLATNYAAGPGFVRQVLARLGTVPGLQHDAEPAALITATTVTPDGDRFLHVLNATGYALSPRITLDGRILLDGARLEIAPLTGRILPLRLGHQGHTIAESTAEITALSGDAVTFRADQASNRVVVDGVLHTRETSGPWTVPLRPPARS